MAEAHSGEVSRAILRSAIAALAQLDAAIRCWRWPVSSAACAELDAGMPVHGRLASLGEPDTGAEA